MSRRRFGVVLTGTVAMLGLGPAPSRRMTARPAMLTPRQQAGQRVVYSYPGLTPPPSLFQHIADGEATGVIFFADNMSSDAQIASVIGRLRQAQRESPVPSPLLLMTQQEGGLVRQLPGEPVLSWNQDVGCGGSAAQAIVLPGEPALSAKQIGQSADPSLAASQAGTGAGQTLARVGMNVNLGPVLDVYDRAGNFIDQDQRAYSNDARLVGTLGRNFIIAQQATGVAATARHFPGLGAASADQDTARGPVTVDASLAGLRGKDEAPYSDAIAAGVKLVMGSWATYPALDAAYPAGLSAAVVHSELRTRLGYQGVTITDALEAGALNAFGAIDRRAVLAAQAGMDVIVCSARDVTQGEDATTALVNALATGQLDPSAFQAAVDRVTALRNSLP
jgi:beta-N-acetylhexosaminidase